jgi:hypothetical protein
MSNCLEIVAHADMVTAIALSPATNLVATASLMGTAVRIYDAARGGLVRELRRGIETASIMLFVWSGGFSPNVLFESEDFFTTVSYKFYIVWHLTLHKHG